MGTKFPTLRGEHASSPDETITRATERLVAKASRGKLSVQKLLDMMTQAVGLAEGILATARIVESPSQEKACRSGCSFCCYLQVDLSVPEVLRIASYLRESLSPQDLQSLRDRLSCVQQQIAGMTSIERLEAKVPCPLLKDGKCSVYEARPLVCRGYSSYDWVSCAYALRHPRVWEAPPHEAAQRKIFSNVSDGLITGFKSAGLRSQPLELIAALRIALDQPKAGERWLAGEPVFDLAVASEE